MKNLLLPALLILAAACSKKPQQVKELPSATTPRLGLVETVYQVLDQKTRERLGYVDRTKYDTGHVIYWVLGSDRGEKLGYVLPNNRAYKYVWEVGVRRPEPEFLGADVMSYQVRRILGYDKTVVLEEIEMEAIAEHLAPDRYKTAPESQKEAPPPADEG